MSVYHNMIILRDNSGIEILQYSNGYEHILRSKLFVTNALKQKLGS